MRARSSALKDNGYVFYFEPVSFTRPYRSCPIHALPKKRAGSTACSLAAFIHSLLLVSADARAARAVCLLRHNTLTLYDNNIIPVRVLASS